MAEIHEGTGVVSNTSSDSCEVSVTIDNTSHSISFNKSVLYTFGVQCEGNMTNILDSGMGVELCYRIFSPGSKPSVVAVWLGEKPDNLTKDQSSLKAVYDSNGHVVSSAEDEFLVQDQDNNIVYISKGVVFQDGSPFKDRMTVDQEIIFDAIPFEYEHPSGAVYQATCAWIGPKPRLVDRFDLRSTKLHSGLSGKDIVEGTVAVIPNDVVALVDVLVESTSIKVFIFRSSFEDRCTRIGDVIAIGDILSLSVAYKSIFPGRKLWYATQAAKSRDELCLYREVSPESLIEVESEPLETYVSQVPKSRDELCFYRGIPPESLVEVESTPPKSVIEIDSKPSCNVTDEQLVKFSKDTEILCNIPPLCGVISLLPCGNRACIMYRDLKILVHRDNFYIAGNRCSDAEFIRYVAAGTKKAYFEAILLSDSLKGEFTHEATCAWAEKSQKPTVRVLAAALCKPNPFLLKKGSCFVGFVAKYLSPFMAFVLIPDEKTYVLIDVSNFVTQPRYLPVDKAGVFITNYVKLNDTVQFNLQMNPKFPALFLTYNIRFLSSVGTSGKVSPDLNRTVIPGLDEKVNPDLNENFNHDKKSSGQKLARKKNKIAFVDTAKKKTSEKFLSHQPSGSFRKDCLSKNRGFLLNCFGNLTVQAGPKGIYVKIKHVFGTSSVNLTRVGFLPSDVLLNSEDMLKLNGVTVRFDAEFIMSESSYQVLRLWNEGEERPDSECLLASSLARWERLFVTLSGCLETREVFYSPACIHSIPLHDSAIATVEKTGLSVLVPLESLVSLREINAKTSSIELFLSIGDKIFAKVVKRNYNGDSYFRTVKCFLGTCFTGEVNSDAEFETFVPRRTTWANIWGGGEWYRKGPIVFENGKYCVSPKKKLPNASLDLFEKGKVFIRDQLVSPEMMEGHVGEEVTVHFAREYPVMDSDERHFVAFAWLGGEPPLKLVLQDVLGVPKGLVSCQWRYEVVVADFLVPTHALCYIGHVPILLRLLIVNDTSFNIAVEGPVLEFADLKVGDRLVVEVEEDTVEDTVVILSDSKKAVKASEYPVKDVYRNLTGTIFTLPEPTGKIQVEDDGFEVAFELCHVRCSEISGPLSVEEWYGFVSDKVVIGRRVFFSAIKIESESMPYRAFEVYFLD